MNRNAVAKFLSLIFIVVFASFGIKATIHVPAPAIEKTSPESLVHQAGHTPNSELEGTYFPATSGGHIAVQKNFISSLNLFPSPGFYSKAVSLENWQIKESSLLIKDYLFHIYPTHNFW